MLPIVTEIDLTTAAEWVSTIAKVRQRKLVRHGDHSTDVSVGAAMIHLMDKRDGLRTIAGLLRGRFDERATQCRQVGESRSRVYFDALPADIAARPQTSVDDLLDLLDLRERTIVEGLAAGRTNREIAGIIGVSEQHIGRLVVAIREKIRNQG